MHSPVHRPIPKPPAHNGPNSSLSLGMCCSPRRHLASTMGPVVALARVKIRTGNLLNTSQRVMSGVMYRSGSQHLLLDNTGHLLQAPSIPPIGFRITFGTI